MTGRQLLALAVVGSGLTGLTAMALFAKGRREEAFALAFTSGLLSTVFAAARVLADDSTGAPRPGAGGPAQGAISDWAMG